jgi:hypothetical protein
VGRKLKAELKSMQDDFHTFRLGFLLAGLLVFSASPAWAKPASTELSDAVALSETIAIVKIVELPGERSPRKPRLNVLRVLKGHLQTGEQEVNFAEYEYPGGPRCEFVAFLDKERRWRFTAAPLHGKNVDSDLLLVYGFAYEDAHWVWPGYLSLAQLTAYLKTGKLVYSFSGPLWFPQHGQIPWAPSGIRIEGSYDAVRKAAHVTGLGKLAGFPAEPSVNLSSRDETPSLHLTYSDRGNRPLEIKGRVQGLDQRTGALIARFVVAAPDVLTLATLRKYLDDPRLGSCIYKVRVHCLATKDFPKRDLLLNSNGQITDSLEGWGASPLEFESAGNEAAESPDDWRVVFVASKGQAVALDFNMPKPTNDKDAFRWEFLVQSQLPYVFDSASVHGTLWLKDGKTPRKITSFSVDVDPVTFGPVYGK